MRYDPIDPQLFVENRKALAAKLKPNSIAVVHSHDILPLCADGVLPFYQNSDLFWLSGVNQEESTLILNPSASDPRDQQLLFVRETSDLIRIWEGEKLTKESAVGVSGIENVQWTDRFESEFRRLARGTDVIYLNANEHLRSATEVETRDDRFRKRCQSLHPGHRYERLAPFLHELRAVKSQIENDLIKRACDITEKGFRRLLGFVKPGVMEYQVEAELSHEFLRHGSMGFAYNPIIASGIGACCLHYMENDKRCEDGQMLLLDVAAEYARYNSDLTRTIPVNGRYTDRQRAVYNSVLRVFRGCFDELLKPGIDVKKDYQPKVGKLMEEELLSLGLLEADQVAAERAKDGTDDEVKEEKRLYRKYFMHGTSHGLGLDVHDVAPADNVVLEGMVMTIEPGIYIPDEGFAVRIENDVIVRESGNIDLMSTTPIESEEIEELMQAGR
ncbi:MAG: Xaa-Pro aminopeptidase [Verrucomicrobiales bacterium]|jgi:Xaa-Pro aminopeptidase